MRIYIQKLNRWQLIPGNFRLLWKQFRNFLHLFRDILFFLRWFLRFHFTLFFYRLSFFLSFFHSFYSMNRFFFFQFHIHRCLFFRPLFHKSVGTRGIHCFHRIRHLPFIQKLLKVIHRIGNQIRLCFYRFPRTKPDTRLLFIQCFMNLCQTI